MIKTIGLIILVSIAIIVIAIGEIRARKKRQALYLQRINANESLGIKLSTEPIVDSFAWRGGYWIGDNGKLVSRPFMATVAEMGEADFFTGTMYVSRGKKGESPKVELNKSSTEKVKSLINGYCYSRYCIDQKRI